MLSWDEYDDNPDKAPPPPIAQETAQAIIYKESENNVPQPSISVLESSPMPEPAVSMPSMAVSYTHLTLPTKRIV